MSAYMQKEKIAKKKNRFQLSREIQESFVNNIAEHMLALAKNSKEWKQSWSTKSAGIPSCAATGRDYAGANMVMLILTSITKGYQDERWVTFKQLQQIQADSPSQIIKITKGAKGVTLLRPEISTFTVNKDGK